jgi:hypothetical protein
MTEYDGTYDEWIKLVEQKYPTARLNSTFPGRIFATVAGKDVAMYSHVRGGGWFKE